MYTKGRILGFLLLVSALILGAASVLGEDGPVRSKMVRLQKSVTSGDSLDAYVTAKSLTSVLARKIALERVEQIFKTYVVSDKTYDRSSEYRELLAVAWDAWPALRDEWNRLLAAPRTAEAKLKRDILVSCWHSTREERALGLLTQYTLNEKGWGAAAAVEAISGVYQGMVADDITHQAMEAYRERLMNWWAKYEPDWKSRMALRRKLAALAATGKF